MIAAVLDWLTSPQGNVVILAIIVMGLACVGWKQFWDAFWPRRDDDPDPPRRR